VLKIVAHYLDGSLVKGTTNDFAQNRETFHVNDQAGQMRTVNTAELKAIFFVKSFEGNHERIERTDIERTGLGKKITVHFKDGEILFGYTSIYTPDRPSFFVFPVDPESNNERVLVLQHSTKKIDFS
jgi:hypothetical protein